MAPSETNLAAEFLSARAKLLDYQAELPAIIKQIRVCRSTLGTILDELELDKISTATLEKIAAHTTGATIEIEGLWEALKDVRAT